MWERGLSMTACRFDVVIVGGGVAGSALGIVLARAGLGVCVVEREPRFRDRVRGEGIHPWGVAEADRLGLAAVLVDAGAQPLPIWQSYENRLPQAPAVWSDVSVDGLPEMGVSHPRLQTAMLAAAGKAGATVLRPAKAASLSGHGVGKVEVEAEGDRQTLEARLIVGADGRGSIVRRGLGGRLERDPEHHRIGGLLLDGVELDPHAAHAAVFPGGRAFLLPQSGGRARVYFVTAAERYLEVQRDRSGRRLLERCAELFPEGALARARPAGPAAFFANADQWSSRLAGKGLVLMGDAAGANDPSVGNGLSLVFRDARELSELLLQSADWSAAVTEFALRRERYFTVLRHHAAWVARLVTEEGPDADVRRERVERARELDPTVGGFGLIFARGPDGLVADEAARARFFGETA